MDGWSHEMNNVTYGRKDSCTEGCEELLWKWVGDKRPRAFLIGERLMSGWSLKVRNVTYGRKDSCSEGCEELLWKWFGDKRPRAFLEGDHWWVVGLMR